MSDKIRINLKTVEDVKHFINVTNSFESDIDVIADRILVDGKSILGVFSLDLLHDVYVRIISDNIEECEKFKVAMKEFS